MKKSLLLISLLCVIGLVGCEEDRQTSTQIERNKQEELSKQGVESVGFPAIVNFAEKRMMKDIIELRDQAVATTTYIVDMNGNKHKICNSVGYGLPYSTQYTNPMKAGNFGQYGTYTIPQADPNGLYSPASADGTWVMCVNPKTGKAQPIYIEPRVIVSPFTLE